MSTPHCWPRVGRAIAALTLLCATLPQQTVMAQVTNACSERAIEGLARIGGWAVSACTTSPSSAPSTDDSRQVLSIDHHVQHASTSPVLAGQTVDLYLRERVVPQTLTQTAAMAHNVALFVHGSWLGSTGAFDLPYQDYNWMEYLARNGFDTFSVDLTGYGYSTRPSPLNDACNLNADQQALLAPGVLPGTCAPPFATQLTTAQSEWDDLDAAVDYVRGLRQVDRVSIVGWSLGGTRAGGYAGLHPDKVDRLVLLGPAYDRDQPRLPAAVTPDVGAPVTLISRAALTANWDRQVQCAGQFDPGIRDAIWTEGLAADGVAWAPQMRRVPSAPSWRWNQSVAAKVEAPTMLVSGEYDQMSQFTVPDAIRAAYADLGSSHKLFVDLACSSHFAMWEANHQVLFQASLAWLRDGAVNGTSEGSLRLGD
jgi:pimeloyl-ACP methyl ester carboxylesterase